MPSEPIVEAVLTASPPVVVLGHRERLARGLDHWCDGTMGIHRNESRTLVVSPNGQQLARHDLMHGGFRHGLIAPNQDLQDPTGPWDHASGGPVLCDEATGDLLLVYHGETFADGDPRRYRSFIGLARSVDDGCTFHDLGPVVRFGYPDDDPDRCRPVEIGSGSPVVHDGWLYLFFQDRGIHEIRCNLSAARVSLDALYAATRRGRVPTLHKYHRSSWASPGLDGPADDLFPGRRPPVLWSDTAYVESLGSFLVVYATVSLVDGEAEWMHMASLSRDAVTWGPGIPLYGEPVRGEILYVTIDSGGSDQRRIEGNSFHLYRVWSDRRWRWDHARLERVRVGIEPTASG
jgi:hypothetical protein